MEINKELFKDHDEQVAELEKQSDDHDKEVQKEIEEKEDQVEDINDAKADQVEKSKEVSKKEFDKMQERKDVKQFTEKLELNEAAETQTEIKELLSDYLLQELEESEFMMNLAWRAEKEVPGYNHDWCAEEASPEYKEKEYEFIDELVEDLMAMCPLEESLKENKLNESNEEDLRKDANSLSDYLSKNELYCDLEDYELYPMGVEVVTFRVEGDWKHDHLYFEDLVEKWAKENGKEIFKMDEHTVEEDGSDYYTADHKVYITDKETSDRLNSMRGLFAPKEESLKEDLMRSSWGTNFKSDVYNTLADIAFKYYKKNINITEDDWNEAIEWFMTHFFESDDNPFGPFGESLKEGHYGQITLDVAKKMDKGDYMAVYKWPSGRNSFGLAAYIYAIYESIKNDLGADRCNPYYAQNSSMYIDYLIDNYSKESVNKAVEEFKKYGVELKPTVKSSWYDKTGVSQYFRITNVDENKLLNSTLNNYSVIKSKEEVDKYLNQYFKDLPAIKATEDAEWVAKQAQSSADGTKDESLKESTGINYGYGISETEKIITQIFNEFGWTLKDIEFWPNGPSAVGTRPEGKIKPKEKKEIRIKYLDRFNELYHGDYLTSCTYIVTYNYNDKFCIPIKFRIDDSKSEKDESLKEDVELWDSDRVVDLARYYAKKYPYAEDEKIIKAIIKTMQKQGATLPSDLKEVEKVYYSTIDEDNDYDAEYDEPYDESLKESAEKFIITKVGYNKYALAKGYPPVVNARITITAKSPEEAKQILVNNGYSEDELVIESLDESKLDEAIPREVAQALKNSNNQEIKNSGGAKYKIPGISKYRTSDIASKDALNKSNIDYEKAEFNKISKEEALNVYKTEPQNLLLIVSDDQGYGNVEQKAIWFEASGDRFGRAENVPDEKAPRRRDGSLITDTKYMTIKQLIDCADSCYWTNQRDVTRDPVLQDIRSKNPESRNYTGLDARNIEQEYSPKNNNRYYVDNNVSRGVSPEYGFSGWSNVKQRRYDNLKARIEELEAELASGNLDRSEKINELERLQGLKSELSQLENTRVKAIGAEKDYNARRRYLTAEQAQRSTMKKFIDLKNAVENADWDLKNAQRNLDDVRKQGGTWSNDYDRRKVSNYTDKIRRLQAQIADYQRMIDELNTKLSSQQVSEEDAKAIADAEANFAEVQNRVQSQKDELNSILDRARARHQNTESLDEDLKVTINFDSFEPYGQAVDTYNRIKDANKLDEADSILEELYPDGIDEDSLNDILAYSPEWLLNELGLADDEEKAMLDVE